MLTAKTVFVLGAGASAPYGFPTGFSLLKSLLGMKRRVRNPRPELLDTYECLVDAGFKNEHIAAFLDELRDSGRSSVDAFLEHRPALLDVGKAAMAAALLPRETHDALFGLQAMDSGHWYQFVFNKLNAAFDDLDRNDVAFLTFNYDRSLEYYLTTAIQNAYGKTFAEAAVKVEKLRILHLYGDLGELTEYDAVQWRKARNLSGEAIRAAADRVHIIHSAKGDEQFALARQWLVNAEVICFLGFGYHPLNVQRLLDSVRVASQTRALGTGHGMGIAERASAQAAVRKSLPTFEINQQNWPVLQFLENAFFWW